MKQYYSFLTASALSLTLFTSAAAQDIQGNAAAGEKKIAMCIGCHGIPGYQSSFPEVHKVPMISGQSAAYVVAALKAYQSGERRHPTMRSVAKGLSEKDMFDVAAYYEQHGKGPQAAANLPAPATQVAQLLEKGGCVGCHGNNFSQPVSPEFPKIAGQHKDYLFVALKSYKAGKQAVWGRENAIMTGIVEQFNSSELKLLAQYLGSQPGELKVIPQSKFR
jgi:cytochrome c553